MNADDESKKERLTDLLRMNQIKYKPIATNTREVPDIEEAVAFEFDIMRTDKTPTVVTIGIDNENVLTTFYDNSALENSKFSKLLPQLKRFAVNNDMTFNTENDDRVDHYMKKRKRAMKKEDDVLSEGWYPVSSQKSAGDHVPQVKIVIEHNRKMNEGEQRFRSINRIFVENTVGERILTPVKETSLARVFARVIAEGDLPHGQRWQHLETLCEEFQKIRGFVRATKSQVNEHALVGLGRSHYESMKETLSRISNHRGYNQYFEDWQPALVEDGAAPDLSKLLESGEDPRIIEALPILHRLQKSQTKVQVSESRELKSLESWADSLVYDALFEDEAEIIKPTQRGGITPKVDTRSAKAFVVITPTDKKMVSSIDQAIAAKERGDKVQYGANKDMSLDDLKAMKSSSLEEGKAVAKDEGIQDPLHDEMYGRTSIPDDVVKATDEAEKISPVIGSKEKKHPFNNKLVGASESVHPAPSLNVNESSEVDDILQLVRMINK